MYSNKKRRGNRRPPMTLGDWFGLACLILFAVCSLILLIRLLSTQMLTIGLIIALVAILIVLNLLHLIVQLPRRRTPAPKIICGLVSLVLSGIMIYTVSAAGSVQNMLMNISGKLVEKEITYVIVMKDSPATDIGDAAGYNFGTLAHADKKNTAALLDTVKNGLGDLRNTPYNNATDLVDALYDDDVDAIMLNAGYISMLEKTDGYKDFSQKTRILYEFTTEHEVDAIKPNSEIIREPFVIYCSGSDARDTDINTSSLSDVNIMAVVNPRTHQVLLLNTPRDYYIPLVSAPYTGELDKLTHVGGFGTKESMKVLGKFYGMDVKYFMRINFTGLIDIVDALGGIDVISPCEFTARNIGVFDNGDQRDYHFKEGLNHLNGHEAMAFCRERDSFVDGDNQRGKNQMTVISAIVDKASSPEILTKYNNLLKAVEGCFTTNMPYEDISALVRMQLSTMAEWNITSYAVWGYDDFQPCATVGNEELYVMRPNEKSVELAQTLVQQVMTGKTPVIPEDDE